MRILSRHTSSRELSHSRGKAIQHTVDVGYYAPAARTTLNLAVFIVFWSEIGLGLANPRVHTLWARARAFRHPAVGTLETPRHFGAVRGESGAGWIFGFWVRVRPLQ